MKVNDPTSWLNVLLQSFIGFSRHAVLVNNKVNILQREKETNEPKADQLGKRRIF